MAYRLLKPDRVVAQRLPATCCTNRRRSQGRSLTKGFASLTLVLTILFVLLCIAGGYWLGYSHRDAQCKATASARQVEALVGTINKASNNEAIKQQLDEQSIQQQAAVEQVQSMIRKEQKQREQFWSKQREANQSCDAWLRAVVPCRMQPEANSDNAATTDSVATTTRMP